MQELWEDLLEEEGQMKRIMTGNEAVARGAYEADVALQLHDPGTPSTEILENMLNINKFMLNGRLMKSSP